MLEVSKEKDDTYELFRQKMLFAIEKQHGNNLEKILKKIYLKYIYQGKRAKDTDIELVNKYLIDLIDQAKWSEDIQEIKDIIDENASNLMINNKEYNYLINKLKEKENEILDGI